MTKINYPETVEVYLDAQARGVVSMLWGEAFVEEMGVRLTESLRDQITEQSCPAEGGEGYCSARCRRLCGLAR